MWKPLVLSAVFGLFSLAQAGGRPDPAVLATRPSGRVVADVVAVDVPLLYNRFGSMNPYGMIYALSSDVEPLPGGRWTLEGLSCPGAWRLKAGVRPRPLVLRGNVGDVLEVRFHNRLTEQPDLSRCRAAPGSPYAHLLAPHPVGAEAPRADAGPLGGPTDWPRTRSANLMIPGVTVRGSGDARTDETCRGLRAVPRGGSVTCLFALERPGTHLFSSTGAPAGGEGDGGSLTHGLFGALHVERRGSQYYRSQVTAAQLSAAWPRTPLGGRGRLDYRALDLLSPLGGGRYRLNGGDLHAVIWEPPPTAAEMKVAESDVLAWAKAWGTSQAEAASFLRRDAWNRALKVYAQAPAFREFTAIFHDELKTVYAEPFESLGSNPQLTGVKDGFGLNYGASGMGSILLANRLGIGPAAGCVECLYEEFFLQSWANGDPALLEQYRSDPANVFHSYLNDRVAFRNLHAGPKETHVFHLHAHQWLSASDEDRGSYLDSQTIAPMQGFQYQIYSGGLSTAAAVQGLAGPGQARPGGAAGHEQTHGSGNRNRTVGDSIFHCHLYPHFAQGMWALWRTHDVLEDGQRTLPDGQPRPGLSLRAQTGPPRPGTDLQTGRVGAGTPIPAVVPLPDQALPPLPSYGARGLPGYPFFIPGQAGHRAPQPPLDLADDAGLPRHVVQAGTRHAGAAVKPAAGTDPHAGHDVHGPSVNSSSVHSPAAQVQRSLALADFSAELQTLKLNLLPAGGTELERRAMQFHAGQFGRQTLPVGEAGYGADYGVLRSAQTGQGVTPLPRDTPATLRRDLGYAGYPSATPAGRPATFMVNGAPGKPGAPYADPCGAPRDGPNRAMISDGVRPGAYLGDLDLKGFRRYDVSAIQLDLVVNKEGWHDPQGRINVLSSASANAPLADKAAYFSNARAREGRGSATAEPFFFRAQSGECVTYYHSNRIPKDLERDDFQMRTPTDIIGQHIHLVKFDVTSADGSGNGWNYEDGTLAPDAVLERKCAYNAWLREQGRPARFGDSSTRFCGAKPPAFGTPEFAGLPVQTTVQRWFVDPIVTVGRTPTTPGGAMAGMTHPIPLSVKKDRTLRTVFTHDHFAPSSIQQHGFYSALLIEPFVRADDPQLADAWLRPDGKTPLADAQGQAVGWHAILRKAQDQAGHRDHREFALAIADFALLYEPRTFTPAALSGPQLAGRQGLDRLLAEARLRSELRRQAAEVDTAALKALPLYRALEKQGAVTAAHARLIGPQDVRDLGDYARRWWAMNGRPVDPPERPEAISTAHHNPFLINYRQEPIPLRLGQGTGSPEQSALPGLGCGSRVFLNRGAGLSGGAYFRDRRIRVTPGESVRAPWPATAGPQPGRGDPAGVFQSALHGDPCTPLLEAYEGELAQFRLVQGAQEVQHVFTVEGLSWKRMPDYEVIGPAPDWEVAKGRGTWPFGVAWQRDNPLGRTNAQEVGISEHFEAQLSNLPAVDRTAPLNDRLYHFGTQDDLWNGAWGLLRVYNGLGARDCSGQSGRVNPNLTGSTCPAIGARLGAVDARPAPGTGALQGPGSVNIVNRAAVYPGRADAYRDAAGRPFGANDLPADVLASCPVARGTASTRLLSFSAVATRLDLLGRAGLVYDRASGLRDPDALILLPLTPADLRAVTTTEDSGFGTPQRVVKYGRLIAHLRASSAARPLQPFVLRAAAGDCVELTVYNALKAPGEAAMPDHPGDAPMPTIVPLNVSAHPGDPEQDAPPCPPSSRAPDCGREVVPSAFLSLTVPQVAMSPDARQNRLSVGWNANRLSGGEDGLAAPPAPDGTVEAHRTLFYAGEVELQPRARPGEYRLDVRPYDFGPLPLRAYSDVLGQGSHGLFGVVVIEPRGASVMRPDVADPGRVSVVDPGLWHTLGLAAFVCTTDARTCSRAAPAAHGFQEFVLAYQDGLNLWWQGRPVGHCTICDDSYDLGDRAFSYAAAPFWARLRQGAGAQNTGAQDTRPGTDLNRARYAENFLLPAFAPAPTFRAVTGQDLRYRVLQVDGRARQHAFNLSGYTYEDQLAGFGSPGSVLVAPGKAFTARLQGDATLAGCSLYRDGPAMFFGAGMWGLLDVRAAGAPTVSRCR